MSAKTFILLRMGQLGKVLEITKAGRASRDANLSLYWLHNLREAWLRTLAFDFEGTREICQSSCNVRGEFPDGQFYALDQMAAGNMALLQGKYSQALEHFKRIQDLEVHTKFFMHWAWRMMAQLESINAKLIGGDLLGIRAAADGHLESALSTSDPEMRALAWEIKARVALAENDLECARQSIGEALTIVDKFENLFAAWQTLGTAWQVYERANEAKKAKMYRDRAASCILRIANTFAPEESLRATFLAAAPIRRILSDKTGDKAPRQPKLKHEAAS
jgi:tetratricopeptide (TPR) repeat protein